MTITARRLRNGALTLALLAPVVLAVWLHDLALRDANFLTGWLLVGSFLVLALYNLRKKMPFLPLGDSASWLQLHVYLGFFATAVFLLHAGLEPNGVLEAGLWVLTALLLASGLVGIGLSRVVPPALTRRGERLIYERIPLFRAQLAREVEELVVRSVEETASQTIAAYYDRRLQLFFARTRNFRAHLLGSRRPYQELSRELRSLDRYLSQPGKDIIGELEQRVMAKDNLDYQYAWQTVLKGWLFVHVPLTCAVMVIAPVHIVLAYAFASATP